MRRRLFYMLRLLMFGLAVAGPVAARSMAPQPDISSSNPSVAITFDDLPFASASHAPPSAEVDVAIDTQRRIVRALKRSRAPATGFVNEERVQALGPAGQALLKPWNAGQLTLGNHGYSHFDSNALNLSEIEDEIIRGEASIVPLAAAVGRKVRFFRFPYNHVGDTELKRAGIESLLAAHGYDLAASTIDTSDYLFNAAYEHAAIMGDTAMMKRIANAYVDYSRIQIAYYDKLDRQVMGRRIPGIMLLHANRLNAATIERILALFRSAHYRFISLEQAQSDPVYTKPPSVVTKYGPMWGYRWAKDRGIKVDGRLEQEPPPWIDAYANLSAR